MDDQRFDQWSRSLHAFGSRRTVTKLLAGGTFATLLTQLGWRDAEAKCVAPGKRCKSKQGKKQKCCGGAKCQGSQCKCPGGRPKCGKRCCPKGQSCAGGNCVPICPPGTERCPTNDGRHKCCADGEICVGDGICVTGRGTCAPGADSCAAGGAIFCNNSLVCACLERLEGGTRCGQPILLINDQCSSDADCLALGFPAGSSCVKDDGLGCSGTDPAKGLCVAPCGFGGVTPNTAALDRLLQPREE